MQAAWEANRGREVSDESRQRMSAAQRRRKDGRAWTAEVDALVRQLNPAEVVSRTDRTLQAVYSRRSVLGLNEGRTTRWLGEK